MDYTVDEPASFPPSRGSWNVVNTEGPQQEVSFISEDDWNHLESLREVSIPRTESELWYVYDFDWYDNLKTTKSIRAMVNRSLLVDEDLSLYGMEDVGILACLRSGLVPGIELDLVSSETWEFIRHLADKYTFSIDVAIPRAVYPKASGLAELAVELYPRSFDLIEHNDQASTVKVVISCKSTLTELMEMAKTSLRIPSDSEVRLWTGEDPHWTLIYASHSRMIRDIAALSAVGESLLVEVRSIESTWPRDRPLALPPPPVVKAGTVGLQNLGNTCFMNSALQCLLHTPPLIDYLSSAAYQVDLNSDNPLGYGGKLATEFASVVAASWSPNSSSAFAPRELKYLLAQHAPQFIGYQQHDAQELLAFLLDGLHEDLNRVKSKPYIPSVDAGDRPDDLVAEEAWENHLKRNQSKIVDLFQGQFKSRLCCPECGTISATFDPFMYLSLPIPTNTMKRYKVSFFSPLEPTRLRRISVEANATNLTAHVANHLGLSDSESLAAFPASLGDFIPLHSPRFVESSRRPHAYVTHLPKEAHVLIVARVCHAVNRGPSYNHTWLTVNARVVGAPIPLALTGSVGELCSSAAGAVAALFGFTAAPTEELFRVGIAGAEVSREDERIASEVLTEGAYFVYDFVLPETDASLATEANSLRSPDWLVDEQWADEDAHERVVSLDQCFELFSCEEKLGEDDQWFCPKCKCHVRAMKKMDLWRLPEIMVAHLKRFQFQRGVRNKISSVIDFPKELNLRRFLPSSFNDKTEYSLFAISEHSGSLYSGHYVASAKVGDSWWSFNDSFTSELSDAPEPDASAYLLFYSRI